MDNIIAGDAISISLTGMAIVFCGLLLISLFICLLPIVLEIVSRVFEIGKEEVVLQNLAVQESAADLQEEKDLATVVGLVIQLETVNRQLSAEQEDIDIANTIGLVLQLEQDRLFAHPN
ncbi:OadG family protein [bacterium]|nr:OadG family protein [bacterium]